MKRTLSILCVLAMLLSLPIAPGIVASADVATAQPSSLVNLWTPENRNWGVTYSNDSTLSWWAAGRGNPGHTATEWITVKAGDIICIGGAYYNMSHISWKAPGASAALVGATNANGLKADAVPSFAYEKLSDKWYIVKWKAPSDGQIQVLNKQDNGNNEFFLVTKNQEFTAKEYYDYFDNNSYLLNSLGIRLDGNGAEVADAAYNTTNYIEVTPGETLTLGPITADQAYFGHAYNASKASVKAIAKADLTFVENFAYTTGFYRHMGSGQAGPNKGFSYMVDETAAFYTYTVPEGVNYIRVPFKVEVTPKFMVVRGKMDMATYKKMEGIAADSNLAGKTALFVGDSVTHATQDSASNKEGINYRGWSGRIADMEDMLVYNYGRTSSSLSNCRVGDGKTGTIINQLNNALSAGVKFDHVVIGGGVNDIWDGIDVGTVTAENIKSGFDQSTFAGGIEATFARAKELYGNAAISYLISYKIAPHGSYPQDQTLIAQYNAVAKAACEKWGINCIDLYNNEKLNAEFEVFTDVLDGFGDNLHPNYLGYDLLAPEIAAGMKKATAGAGATYQPVPLAEANLWTTENRNWGVRLTAGTQYWGSGRSAPGHNGSEWIDVKKGDQIYFGASYTPGAVHCVYWPAGATSWDWNDTNILWLDKFTNADFSMGVWTAPGDGKLIVADKQSSGVDDFFVITKNRPFSMAEYLELFNNHVWILEAQGKYVTAAGVETADANYFTTDYIKVTEGEVLTLGPVVTGTQVHFGTAYNAAKKAIKAISYNDLTWKDSFDYETGYYAGSPKKNATSAEIKNNLVTDYQYYLATGADVYTYTVPAGVEYIRATFMTNARTKAFVLRGDVGIDGYYATNGIKADNPLIGKSALFIGDSITEAANDWNKEGVDNRGWAARIADKYDMMVDNYGISGYWFATVRGKDQILNQLNTARHNDYDYVMIHGGTNDLSYSQSSAKLPKGTIDPDEFDFEDFDQATFSGALEATIAKAVELFGDTASIAYIWNYQIKNSNWFTDIDNGAQELYYPTAEAVCEKWGIPLIDLYHNEDLAEEFYDETTPAKTGEVTRDQTILYDGTYDNVHCNALGLDLLAPIIGAAMEEMPTTPYRVTEPSDKKEPVIALVGDDLTLGLGSSDVYRKSYPAVLTKLLGEEYTVLNYAAGNATIQQDQSSSYIDSLTYAESLKVNPDKLVIMLGSNDFKTMNAAAPNLANKIEDQFTYLVKKYQATFPEAEIYLANPPAATNENAAAILQVAAPLYSQLATKLGVNFIDVYTATKADVAGYVSDDACAAGVWYNDAGYQKIAEAVLAGMGLTAVTAPVVDTTAEYTGTYPSVPTLTQYAAADKYRAYDAYRIVTVDDWKAFGELVGSGVNFAGKTVYLENDLDMADMSIFPVGRTGSSSNGTSVYSEDGFYHTGATDPDNAYRFCGTFDGKGHTVNIDFRHYYLGVGLFASTYGATIKNLNVTGNMIGYDMTAAIVAYCDGATNLENIWSGVNVTNLSLQMGKGVGGIAANFRNGGSMINVGCSGTITGQRYVGGLAAYAHNSTTAVKNCYFNGKIYSDVKDPQTNILVRNAKEEVHENNMIIADKKNVIPNANYAATVKAETFSNGVAAAKLNGEEGTVWTVKDGKTVIAATEDKATIKVTLDGKTFYTDSEGKVFGEIKTETGYFYVNNELVTDAEMNEFSFDKETATMNSVAKLAGDATGNAAFEMADITAVMRHLVDYPDRIVEANADYSGNGVINIVDVVRMLKAQA